MLSILNFNYSSHIPQALPFHNLADNSRLKWLIHCCKYCKELTFPALSLTRKTLLCSLILVKIIASLMSKLNFAKPKGLGTGEHCDATLQISTPACRLQSRASSLRFLLRMLAWRCSRGRRTLGTRVCRLLLNGFAQPQSCKFNCVRATQLETSWR